MTREWSVWITPTRVIDGDTFEGDVDLGWGVWRKGERVRVLGVNTPERGKPGGKEATQAAAEWLGTLGTLIPGSGGLLEFSRMGPKRLVSHGIEPVRFGEGRDHFGRVLGTVTDHNGESLAQYLIDRGFGVPA